MKITRRWLAVIAASVLISSVPVTGYGAVIYREDLTTQTKESTKQTGPGYLFDDEDEIEFAGPGVKKVSLIERYHADYELYEESIADLFFLYSTVANGAITHKAVTIDIPANITYTMEKDGLPYAYASRQKVSASGTYVLRLTALENPELPLSEQTEYQATFRFRIQDTLPVSEREQQTALIPEGSSGNTGTSQPSDSGSGNGSSSLWNNPDVVTYPVDGAGSGQQTPAGPAKDAVQDAAAEAAAGVKPEAGVSQPVEQAGSDTAQSGPENNGGKAEPEKEPVPAVRTQVYDPVQGKYIVTLENGLELISTVPEGYVGPASVGLMVADGLESRAELYRDDVQIEFVSGNSQLEPGVYRLELDGCAYAFTIARSVNNMDVYPAPVGMRFAKVLLDDEAVTLTSDQNLFMKTDGTYSIFLKGDAGEELEVALLKDTAAPTVTVTVKGGTAEIRYESDDIVSVTLEKDGQIIEGFGGTAISVPGSYRLTAVDEAGNTAAVGFEVDYQINMYGVVAVVLVLAVIVALAVFVLHTKKNMKIR